MPQQPDDSELDVLQHPTLGTLKFPKAMGPSDRNAIIDNMMAQQKSPGPNPSTPAAPPAPPAQSAGQSFLSKAWEWSKQPVNIGHLRQSLTDSESYANSGPTLDEAQNHPYSTPIKKALSGFGADAGKMLLTPQSIALAATGMIGEGVAASAKAAEAAGNVLQAARLARVANAGKIAMGATSAGFGIQGGSDLIKNPGMQPGEKPEDYIRRAGMDAAMVLGGATGVGEAAHVVKAPAVPDNFSVPQTVQAPTPEARTAQALGKPASLVQPDTIHVDPAFAQEMQTWNNNPKLAAKRVILQKDGTVGLVHTDPKLEGFQKTETTANAAYSTDGSEGQVPVNLSRSNGIRQTTTPGHYLSADFPEGVPESTPAPAAPPEASPAAESIPPTPRQPDVLPTPPEASYTPEEQANLRSQAMEADPTSPAVASVPKPAEPEVAPEVDPNKRQPGEKYTDWQKRIKGGVEPGPEVAPAEVAKPEETPQALTPPVDTALTPKGDVAPLEDKIRPLVGQLANLKRLRLGELASHTIDKAIESAGSLTDTLDEDTRTKVGKLLNEPVGDNITAAQANKLEAIRGAQGAEVAVPRHASKDMIAQEMARDPDAWQSRLDASFSAMAEDLNNPDTPPEMKAKLTKALMSEDANGNPKPFLYERGALTYPKPEALDAAHPEAPFGSAKLGHDITPINVDNYAAALGRQPRDLFLSSSSGDKFRTPEEKARMAELQASAPTMPEGFKMSDLTGQVDEEGNVGGIQSVSVKGSLSREAREYARQVRQNVLDRKIAATERELGGHVGNWQDLRNGAETDLTKQLSALPNDVRKHLPSELFDHEKPTSTPSPDAPKSAEVQEPTQTTSTPKEKQPAVTTGQATPFEGIKTNKFDTAILKKFPEKADEVDMLQKAVSDRLGVGARQAQYDKVSKTYFDAVKAGDAFALNRAMQKAVNWNEMGAVGDLNKVFNPDENHAINASTADALLAKWEGMSDPELFKKAEGLRGDSLTQRLDGAAPSSDDPALRLAQTERYNELLARHQALLDKVGPSSNVGSNMIEAFKKWNADHPEQRDMRMALGERRRNDAILKSSFDKFDRLMNALPIPEQMRFFDNMMTGSSQVEGVFQSAIDPDFLKKWTDKNGDVPHPNDVAQMVRQALDGARDRVTERSGKLENFIVNYMPGMYQNVGAARQFVENWASRRPLAGNADFLKQKMYELHSDALKAGLQPVTSNPVRAAMLRVEQLNRFSMAYDMKNSFIDKGLAQFFTSEETPPAGYVKLNDSLFGQGNGNYWASEPVARSFNNFVSTGLGGKWVVPHLNFSMYDSMRSVNDTMNRFQLGVSAFHAVETTFNSGFTALETGFKQIMNDGRIKDGLLNIAKAPIAIVEDAINGSRGLTNWNNPAKSLDYGMLSHDLEVANANVAHDAEFTVDNILKQQQIQNLKEAWSVARDNTYTKGTRAGAAFEAMTTIPKAAVETLSWPLMNWLIPRVKMGAFYRMSEGIHQEMEGRPPDEIHGALQKAWDSVDNRFGEVNYENLFMKKTTTDLMKLLVRSPGWNIGTAREIGGGLKDAVESLSDLSKGKGLKISNRTAYTLSMTTGTMLFNGVYQYMHPNAPAPEGIDFIYPRDGSKTTSGEWNRVYPKTYLYDPINLMHDPMGTVWHKAAPDISVLANILQNKDYYGREIRDPGASLGENTASLMSYVAHQVEPFTFGNMSESKMRNQPFSVQGAAGILPAPRWVGRSDAENLAFRYFSGEQSSEGRSARELERKQNFVNLRNDVANGKITDEQMQQALDSGKIKPSALKYLYDTKQTPNIVNWTQRLTDVDKVWHVWQAATPAEKEMLLPIVQKKIASSQGGEQQIRLEELERFSR